MKNIAWTALCLVVAGALLLPTSSEAIQVLDPDYELEEYVTIDGASWVMTFDGAGNLYLMERLLGRITKVTPEREVSVFTTITPPAGGDLVGITWTGGSAFGAYLYALRRHGGSSSDVIYIDPDDGSWSTLASFGDCGTYLGLDRTGLYGGDLYTGTGCRDKIYRVTPGGGVTVFSPWPFGADGGGPRGIDFDPSGQYGGHMYVASAYDSSAAHVSGLFQVDTSGNATRFTDAIVFSMMVLFAPDGPMFDQEMFVFGRDDYANPEAVWRIAPDGSAEKFVTDIDNSLAGARYTLAFGPDGALYSAQYSPTSDRTTVYRVFVPQGPRERAILKLKRAIDEKTVAIEAIALALANEREALAALETLPTNPPGWRVRTWIRIAMVRQRLSRQYLLASRALLIRAVDLLERDRP